MRIDGSPYDLTIHDDHMREGLDLRPAPPPRMEPPGAVKRLLQDGLLWQLRLGGLALDVYAYGALKALPSSPEPHCSRGTRPAR